MAARTITVAMVVALAASACSAASEIARPSPSRPSLAARQVKAPPPSARQVSIPGGDRAPTSSAAVIERGVDGYDVFYRGWNGVVLERTLVGGTWSAPTSLGVRTLGAPAVATPGRGVVLVTRGPANDLTMRVRSGGHWSPPRSLAITVTAAPAVVAWDDGRVAVFARGQDRRLYTRVFQGDAPTSPWRRLSADTIATPPAAAATGNGRLTVLVANSRHELMRRTLTDDRWSAWNTLGGRTWDAPAMARIPGTRRILALIRGTDDQLYSRELPGSTWQARGGALIDAPAATAALPAGNLVVLRDRSTGFVSRTVRTGVWSGVRPAWVLAGSAPPRASLLGNDWTRIPTARKIIALTFDAGANADGYVRTRTALERANVPATFFLTGAWVRQFPAEAIDVAESGFMIGNHTDNHLHLPTLTNAQIDTQVRRARTAILNTNGVDPRPVLRFPYGDVTTRVLTEVNRLGYVAVRWTIDTLGWKGTSGGITVQKVIDRVVDGARPGAIVLMHIGSNPKDHTTLDAAALPSVITRLRALGYSLVTLTALTG